MPGTILRIRNGRVVTQAERLQELAHPNKKRKADTQLTSNKRKVPRIDVMQAVLDDSSVLENIFSRVAPGNAVNVAGVSKTWESIILKTYGAVGLLMGIMKGATKDGQQLGYFKRYIKTVIEPDALTNLASYACSKDYIMYLKAIMAQFVQLYGPKAIKKSDSEKYFGDFLMNLNDSCDVSEAVADYITELDHDLYN